jgi:hypothetical protein
VIKLKRIFVVPVMAICLLSVHACTDTKGKEEPAVFRTIPELSKIKPEKPVKIKLKRNKGGEYTWELSGDSPDKVIEADKQLKETFGKNKIR